MPPETWLRTRAPVGVGVAVGVEVAVFVGVEVAVLVGVFPPGVFVAVGVAVFVGVPVDVAVGVGPFPRETTVFPNDGKLPQTILFTLSLDVVRSTSVLPSRCKIFNLLNEVAFVIYGTLTQTFTGCENEAVVEKLNAGPTRVLFAGAVPDVLGSMGTEVVVPDAVTEV